MSNVKIAFFSDLDLTLVYSHRAMKRYHDPLYGSIVIDMREGDPMGYMRVDTWELFRSLTERGVEFIPVTTRTKSQYSHIKIPAIEPQNAIVLSGAQVICDGELSKEWESHMASEISKLTVHPDDLHRQLSEKALAIPGVNKMRCAEGMFIYAVKDEAENAELAELFSTAQRETGYVLSHQGRKSYLVPRCVDKGAAIKYLQAKLSPETSVAAGDSVLDLSMADAVDDFLQPLHGEAVGMLSTAIVTPNRGIEAAGDIMFYLETKLAQL